MSRFTPGRPRGARNKVTAQVFADVLEHWNDPVEGSNRSHGWRALELMWSEAPNEYVRAVLSILPKDLQIETIRGNLAENQVDELISRIKEELLDAQKDNGDAG